MDIKSEFVSLATKIRQSRPGCQGQKAENGYGKVYSIQIVTRFKDKKDYKDNFLTMAGAQTLSNNTDNTGHNEDNSIRAAARLFRKQEIQEKQFP